ncbi:MAG: lytic transglycosylase domain-containing protein [Defluviimonas sp.]|nr:lytic transglycosylase domain-containing protein [Paracoccaceae bacterium]MCC0064456.1 lytic transglycosylase domain-containing protein [Defluviimonas sp.]
MTESGAAASSGDSATPVPSVEKAPEGASGSPALPAARAVQAPRKEFEPFTFKRISAPVAGAAPAGARRITVQIDPDEQARRLATAALPLPENPIPRGAAAPGLGPVLPQPSDYDWYWNSVSPALGATDGRFPQALAALNAGPEGKHVPTPRSQKLQDIAAIHGREILSATVGTNVSPALVLAIISVESAGRADAVSSAGAAGLMQLIPATADRFGVDDRIDPSDNIKGGVAYLDWLMKEFNGDPLMVIAACNAGENSVKGNAGVPPFAETRAYVPKVLAAWSVARGLCVTPPDLVTDGCVFAVNG